MTTNISIATAERQGFTHIEVRCECNNIVCYPFRMLKEEGRANSESKLSDIAARMRCVKCGTKPPKEWKPWKQYMHGNGWPMGYLRR
jgi:hypothetical protein